MKNKIAVLGLVAVAAGVFAYTRPHNATPTDLRDAVADSGAALGQLGGDRSVAAPEPKPEVVKKGYVGGNNSAGPTPTESVQFIALPAGKFSMGTDSGELIFENARPIHEVSIEAFEMSKTPVTVAQYAECVDKGACSEPNVWGDQCNWGKPGRKFHPVNCVDWFQAESYASFKNARLPSEAEFEYAATSGGKNQKYPWGNRAPTSELAVFDTASTMPVCSKPKGNTAQGLCDMSGNVRQWVMDDYKGSYNGATVDGSAYFGGNNRQKTMRGGGFGDHHGTKALRADFRAGVEFTSNTPCIGFRLARSIKKPVTYPIFTPKPGVTERWGDCTVLVKEDKSFTVEVLKESSGYNWVACPSDNPEIEGLLNAASKEAKECAKAYGVNLDGARADEGVSLSPTSDLSTGWGGQDLGYCVAKVAYRGTSVK